MNIKKERKIMISPHLAPVSKLPVFVFKGPRLLFRNHNGATHRGLLTLWLKKFPIGRGSWLFLVSLFLLLWRMPLKNKFATMGGIGEYYARMGGTAELLIIHHTLQTNRRTYALRIATQWMQYPPPSMAFPKYEWKNKNRMEKKLDSLKKCRQFVPFSGSNG